MAFSPAIRLIARAAVLTRLWLAVSPHFAANACIPIDRGHQKHVLRRTEFVAGRQFS